MPNTARIVAVVPARGGSKGIPGKNLQEVGGRSLVQRAVDVCRASRYINEVWVSTDDDTIADHAISSGGGVIHRPDELAGDHASSESALLHALEHLNISGRGDEILVFVQCTSPFINAADVDAAIQRVVSREFDSVFAAVPTFEFLWRLDGDTAYGLNHDHSRRLRRQDRDPDYRETGAFYVMRVEGFVECGHRFFGRIGVQPVAAETSLEIDEAADLVLARGQERTVRNSLVLPPFRLLVTDFDGVHTDDRAYVTQDGVEGVVVNRRDGHGVKLLRAAGVDVVILSTERNEVVAARARKLEIECLHGVDDKVLALESIMKRYRVDAADVAYVGNDVNDLQCLEMVGVPICVSDAHVDVLPAARYVTRCAGGAGAIREIADARLASVRD